MGEKKLEIVTVSDLKSFFYESLKEVNSGYHVPVRDETLIYSSDVLEKFSHSEEYFVTEDGKVREKILGQKLLSAANKPHSEQQVIYKDIGDTSLFLCGYFSESIGDKLLDISYYQKLGASAYSNLDSSGVSYLDIPAFYGLMAKSFGNLVDIIAVVASKDQSDPQKHLLLSEED